MLAGTGTVLDATQAQRLGLVDQVVPRASFEESWRTLARSLATAPAGAIKQVVSGTASPDEAVAAFARLWVSDAHWAAADRVLTRGT